MERGTVAKVVGSKGGGGRYKPKLRDATPYDQVVSGLQKMGSVERKHLIFRNVGYHTGVKADPRLVKTPWPG